MRNRVFQFTALLAFLLFSGTAFSQIGFGPKVGVNFSNVTFDADNLDVDTKGKTDLSLGLVFELPIANFFLIQPEVTYLGRGYRVDFPVIGESTYNIAYIDVGALAKLRFGSESALTLGAGPFFSYAVSGQIKDDNGKTDVDFDNYKRSDFTLATALGFELGARDALRFFGDIRYLIGLGDLNSDNNSIDYKSYNRVFNVNVGILIPL
ncbi:MAG: hypothetical protein DHS20C18_07890 [Saprospiraceae bacterium]|nr:MAG: hypothetical protein DHS20C18_07890 [Saprospiraceae bacterium]